MDGNTIFIGGSSHGQLFAGQPLHEVRCLRFMDLLDVRDWGAFSQYATFEAQPIEVPCDLYVPYHFIRDGEKRIFLVLDELVNNQETLHQKIIENWKYGFKHPSNSWDSSIDTSFYLPCSERI